MTKDEALKMALEALEDMNCGWKYIRESHGDLYGVGWDRAQGKADDAIEALRQALEQPSDSVEHGWYDIDDISDYEEGYRAGYIEGFKAGVEIVQPEQKPVNHIPDTTKMMEPSSHKDLALKYGIDALLEFATGETPEGWKAIDAIGAMRQALAQPDTGTDRGAWSDVPDATKWVDELRGDEDLDAPPNSTTDVAESTDSLSTLLWRDLKTDRQRADWLRLGMGYQTGVVAAAIQQELAMAYERLVGFQKIHAALEQPEREWVGLTDDEKWSIFTSKDWTGTPLSLIDAVLTAYEEKNRD